MGADRCRANDAEDATLVAQRPGQGADTVDNQLGLAINYLRSESAARRFRSEPRPGPAQILALQRQAGNALVSRFLESKARPRPAVQREGENQIDTGMDSGGEASIPPAAQELVGSAFTVALTTPEPLEVTDTGPNTSGPGDFPAPGENGPAAPDQAPTVMAFSGEYRSLQRDDDDDKPHSSGDASAQGGASVTPGDSVKQVPVQIAFSYVYRNMNVTKIGQSWDVIHEPQAQVIVDSRGTIYLQEAITLVNFHWKPPWKAEIETGLSAFAQEQIAPAFGAQGGAQVQAEQHINGWFSVTATLSGSYQLGTNGQKGVLSLGGGLGVLIHFDGYNPGPSAK